MVVYHSTLPVDLAKRCEQAKASPRWGEARFDQDTKLVLHFLQRNEALVVDMNQVGHVIIGRHDAKSTLVPDIDLSVLNAAEGGVSRYHIQLELVNNMLRVTDMNSLNGTSVNGKLLIPYQSVMLRDGDELSLGLLKCMVFFKDEL